MKEIKGRNGGTLKQSEKGDPGQPGAGRPPGSRSFKTLLEEALDKTTNGKDGKKITLKEASAMQMLGILLSSETDDNTKLKAFQIIRDTLGENPVNKAEITGKDGAAIEIRKVVVVVTQDADDK